MEKAVWDAYHTRIFCEVCAKEVQLGNRPGPFLSSKGYKNLEDNFFTITKERYVKKQFKNRWDALKKDYTQWKELKIAASGLGWDNKLNTVDASSDWWNTHIEKYPDHARYRNGGPANLDEMDIMFDGRHVTGATSAIPGEVPSNTVDLAANDTDEDDEPMQKKTGKRKKSSHDDFSAMEEKNPFFRMYKKATDAICVTAEATTTNRTPPSTAPSMLEAMEMVRQCGVEEGTPLFFSSSMLFMKPEYREMFASVQTKEGRFDWLERAHDM